MKSKTASGEVKDLRSVPSAARKREGGRTSQTEREWMTERLENVCNDAGVTPRAFVNLAVTCFMRTAEVSHSFLEDIPNLVMQLALGGEVVMKDVVIATSGAGNKVRSFRYRQDIATRESKFLLREIFISIQCEEFNKLGKKPVSLSALVDLIKHHPGLKDEVVALQKLVDAKRDLNRTFLD